MTALVIVIPVFVVLAAILLVGRARRRDTGEAIGSLSRETVKRDKAAARAAADVVDEGPTGREVEASAALERREASTAVATTGASTPAPWTPPDPETLGVTRRQFLNRSIVGLSGFGLSVFGVAIVGLPVAVLLRRLRLEDPGRQLQRHQPEDHRRQRVRVLPGRPDVDHRATRRPPSTRPAPCTRRRSWPRMEAGFVPLYQKCVHLGCRVPECTTSQWFECPCHGSQYNQAGEKKGGPAPRGLDRFASEVSGDTLAVDTGTIIQGPPIGTNTTGQEAEGPHCIGTGGGGH